VDNGEHEEHVENISDAPNSDYVPNDNELKDIQNENLKKRREIEEQLSQESKQEFKEKAENLKKMGNECYGSENYEEAIEKFTEALNICPLCFSNERAIYLANRAAAKSNIKNIDSAIEDCTEAIDLNGSYLKVILRRARLYELLDRCHEALKDYKKVIELDPSHKESLSRIKPLEERAREKDEKLKAEMMSNLKNLGNMCLKPFGLSTNNFEFNQDPSSGGYTINFKK